MSQKESPFEFFRLDGIEIVKINEQVLNFQKHTHTADFTCSVITMGEAQLTCKDRTVDLQNTCCFTILPNYPHSIISGAPVSMVSLCISTGLLKEYKDDHAGYREKIVAALDSASVNDETASILCDTADDIFKLYRLADVPLAQMNDTEKDPYYSKYHYIRMFSKNLGLTPHKYHLQCRIREAQKLLMSGYSSADAAAQEDFYDQSHFIKCFKTVVGITPSEYKASLRNFLQSR